MSNRIGLLLAVGFIVGSFAATPLLAKTATFVNPDIIMVKFHEEPLAKYSGGVNDLKATSPAITGERKLNYKSADSQAYLKWLRGRQDQHMQKMASTVGRPIDVLFRYDVIINGFAIKAQPGDLEKLASLSEIADIQFDVSYAPDTDRGPTWIGADTVWDGSGTGGLGMTKGEGVVIGVLDTGVNFGHPSFADDPDDGHTYVNPQGSGVFVGWCNPAHPNFDPAYACNDKLIGAWDFVEAAAGGEADGPVDNDGHGSHTASTAGGNTLTDPAISGVAPHANLITYDVCAPAPTNCPGAATSAAAQQAIIDGVDVINYSISGGGSPWSSFDIDSHFLDLVAAGAFVAASAGNGGPGPATTGHHGPWVATIAASTHDREAIENELINMASSGVAPPADLAGQSRTSVAYGPAPIVYAGDFANANDPGGDPAQCLQAYPPGTWSGGEIVLCDRGAIARVLKCANVAAGGAAGCVLANVAGSPATVADPHVIPAIHVDETNGDTLRAWLAGGSGHMAEITASTTLVNPALGDVLAGFSSRGPASIEVIKPDLTAPGVAIFAAVNAGGIPGFPGPDFGNLSGTSMSSPHTAGSAALIKALHPTWTPSEIRSALMTTAHTAVLKDDAVTPADPFDVGAGRVDLGPASQAGLVLDETEANFLAADPSIGGEPSTLNLSTAMSNNCVIECVFTRTVKNARSFATDWTQDPVRGGGVIVTADPATFSLAPGATQEIDFTVSFGGGGTPGVTQFGEASFTEDNALASAAHFTFAVIGGNLASDPIEIESYDRSGSVMVEDIVSAGATDLQLNFAGVVPVNQERADIETDATNDNAFDSDQGTVTYWMNGLTGARKILAQTLDSQSSAPDLDVFVGRDTNTNGTPDAGEVVCSSTTASAEELCEITDPADGDWWVRVQNWSGSGAPTDTFTLRLAAVDGTDAGNFSATGPMVVAPGAMFDITVDWDFGALGGDGDYVGVLDFGSSPGNEGDLGTVNVSFSNDRLLANGFD